MKEQHMWHDLQSNHIPHAPRAPEKSDSNPHISHLSLCFLLPFPVKSWGRREGGGTVIFYECLPRTWARILIAQLFRGQEQGLEMAWWWRVLSLATPGSDTKSPFITAACYLRHRKWRRGIESACRCKKYRFGPWVGKIRWKGNGNPFQYFCLENPTDRGAWWAPVHGVTESQTGLSTWASWASYYLKQVHVFTLLFCRWRWGVKLGLGGREIPLRIFAQRAFSTTGW